MDPPERKLPTTDDKPPMIRLLATRSQLTDSLALVLSESIPEPCCQTPDDCPHGEICSLSKAAVGSSVRVKQLTASPETTRRLRELGFTEDQTIRLVSRQANVICQVCNARLGLSMALADTILVQAVPRRAA